MRFGMPKCDRQVIKETTTVDSNVEKSLCQVSLLSAESNKLPRIATPNNDPETNANGELGVLRQKLAKLFMISKGNVVTLKLCLEFWDAILGRSLLSSRHPMGRTTSPSSPTTREEALSTELSSGVLKPWPTRNVEYLQQIDHPRSKGQALGATSQPLLTEAQAQQAYSHAIADANAKVKTERGITLECRFTRKWIVTISQTKSIPPNDKESTCGRPELLSAAPKWVGYMGTGRHSTLSNGRRRLEKDSAGRNAELSSNQAQIEIQRNKIKFKSGLAIWIPWVGFKWIQVPGIFHYQGGTVD
ncbi:hypothetical protein ACJ72_05937 [Emergomyces africanus]|uniref:Uncharacterized protein n=1 Tax=Emergomyces africanus TaxID=1955775 RepID=A0A1B7NSH8_9EURO|nr:hypothetical protein ACJ72_05937 [Emergomyces africanus]